MSDVYKSNKFTSLGRAAGKVDSSIKISIVHDPLHRKRSKIRIMHMFAVVKTGGKQYRVTHNDVLKVEKLEGKVGDKIKLEDVLAVEEEGKVHIGAPKLKGMKVEAEILDQKKDKKVLIFKKRRRHNSRRKNGHRQEVTYLRIISINGKKASAPKKTKVVSNTKEEKKEVTQTKKEA